MMDSMGEIQIVKIVRLLIKFATHKIVYPTKQKSTIKKSLTVENPIN